MNFGRERFEKPRRDQPAEWTAACMPTYLSVRLRISMGSSSKTSGCGGSGALSCSVLLTKTSPSTFSSSSGRTLAFKGSSISGTWGPCKVLARVRDVVLLGAASRRVKDRDGCRSLGRADMVGVWLSCRVACLHRNHNGD